MSAFRSSAFEPLKTEVSRLTVICRYKTEVPRLTVRCYKTKVSQMTVRCRYKTEVPRLTVRCYKTEVSQMTVRCRYKTEVPRLTVRCYKTEVSQMTVRCRYKTEVPQLTVRCRCRSTTRRSPRLLALRSVCLPVSRALWFLSATNPAVCKSPSTTGQYRTAKGLRNAVVCKAGMEKVPNTRQYIETPA